MAGFNANRSSPLLLLGISAAAFLLGPEHLHAQQIVPAAAANTSVAALAATPLTGACGQAIKAPGTYVLTADIGSSAPCSGDGIDIMVSNVKLMLNGHAITGNGGAQYTSVGAGINI